jgi:hypothetical protein
MSRKRKPAQSKEQKAHSPDRLKQILEDLRADAPQPLPFEESLEAKAERLLEGAPKLRSFLDSQIDRIFQDPVLLVQQFIRAEASGDPIPEDILAWLADGFRSWGRAKGARGSLERALGLAGEPGKDRAYDVAVRRARDKVLFSDMITLTSLGLKLTFTEAAEMACRRFEESYPEAFDQHSIDADSLARRFRSFPYEELKSFLKEMGVDLLPTDLAEYLGQFPLLSIPERLRPLLRQPATKPKID